MKLRPDVLVTDISMPKLSGLEAVDRLRESGCTSKVIFLTAHSILISSPLVLQLVHSHTSIRLLWPPTCCSPSKKLSRDAWRFPVKAQTREKR